MSIKATCVKHGHNFMESSVGKGPKPAQKVVVFCSRCGETKAIEAPK